MRGEMEIGTHRIRISAPFNVERLEGALKVIIRCLTICLFVGFSGAAVRAETLTSDIRWAPDLVSAREASARFKVPLMIHFHGDGCLPCRTLEQRVFKQPEIIETLNKYFICHAINCSQHPQMAAEFGVHAWPTDVFMSPDGETLFTGVSPQDPREYMQVITNVAVMNRDKNLLQAAKTDNPGTQPGTSFVAQNSSSHSGSGGMTGSAHPELKGLPSLGAQSESTSTTPNFYSSAPQSQSNHQLAGSLSSDSTVQSGPAIPSQQPTSVTGPAIRPEPQNFYQQTTPPAPIHNVQTGKTPSPFPPLPGMEVTEPIRSAQESDQRRLATLPAMPRAEGAAMPVADGPAMPATENLVRTDTASTVGAFQVSPGTASQKAVTGQLVSASPHIVGDSFRPTTAPAEDNSMKPRLTNAPSTASGSTHSEGVAAEQPNLDGFCPIALRNQQWLPGSAKHAIKHRGKIYWMSSPDAEKTFLERPDDFAPVLSGYDPQVLLYQGKLVAGSTQHGLFEAHSGQVMLFSSAESKASFQQDFTKNMQALNAVRQKALAK